MSYKSFLVILLSLVSFSGFAQDENNSESKLVSPYHSLYTLLYYQGESDYRPELFREVVGVDGLSKEKKEDIAVKLKQILDGEGIFIYLDEVPKNAQYFDSLNQKHRYVIASKYPKIFMELQDGEWKISSRSVTAIEEAHKNVFPLGTDKLLNLLPRLGSNKILGLAIWQHLGILILAFLCFLIHKLFTLAFRRTIVQFLSKAGHPKIADRYILPVARPSSLFIVVLLLVFLVPVLQLPIHTSKYVIIILKALLPLFGVLVFYKIADILSLYLQSLAQKTESTLDDQLVPLFRKTLKTFIVIVGGLFILENLNIPILPLLTGLSIGGLAFALAAQDTIKNFFGSLMIFIDKPFQIGDWITSSDIDGTVEEVGFRSTRVRTFRNSVVYIPNGRLADSTIDNHGLRKYRRFYTQLALTYDTPAPVIQVFVDGLKEIVARHPKTRKDAHEIHFNQMADSSLNVMFYIFFDVPSWSEELLARHQVLIEVVKLAEQLGVNFAFPTQTIHIENQPGQPSLSPEYDISRDGLKKKLETYLGV